MRRILHGKKLNNVGMSLIEVVVAIAILSIAILPILYTFVYSTRYNGQARVRQQTTAAAQTVMENFKAYSVEEICNQFNTGTFNVNSGTDGAGNRLVSMSCSGYTDDPDSNMDFTISRMRYQDADYDVEIELTPHNSSAAKVESLIYEVRSQENSAAYAVQNPGMDADALEQILTMVAAEWSDKENLAMPELEEPVIHHSNEVDRSKIAITREIKVDIVKDGDNYVAKVFCEYAFVVTRHPYRTDVTTPDATSNFDMSDTYNVDLADNEIFNRPLPVSAPDPSGASEPPVLHLTLFYFPAYSYKTPAKIDTDNITINNSTDADVRCYIYKQKNGNVSDGKLSTSESTYEVHINLTDANVYDDNLNVWLGDRTDPARSLANTKIHVDGGVRYYGVGYQGAHTVTQPARDEDKDKTVKELRRMYNISISVYNNGGKARGEEPLSVLDGTIVE